MNSKTVRQRGLYLVARLYELAAEFTDAELLEISDQHSQHTQSPAIKAALQALRGLHGASEGESAVKIYSDRSDRKGKVSAEVVSLANLLSDPTAFPTVADIANAVSIDAKPKESRERYITRVSRIVGLMDTRDRAEFLKRVTEKVKTKPLNFISDWSKLIKEM